VFFYNFISGWEGRFSNCLIDIMARRQTNDFIIQIFFQRTRPLELNTPAGIYIHGVPLLIWVPQMVVGTPAVNAT
jgi:hypothetical protein